MTNYVLAYHDGKEFDSPEAQASSMERWGAWLSGLGDAVVNPGTPLGMSKTVTADGVTDGGGPYPLLGYTIVQAESMESALEMAKACPFLEIGTIVVSQAMEM